MLNRTMEIHKGNGRAMKGTPIERCYEPPRRYGDFHVGNDFTDVGSFLRAGQSNLAPDSLITFAQRDFSLAMNWPNCSGVIGRTSAPAPSRRVFISGVARIFVIASCNAVTISFGVLAAATMPWNEPVSKPGYPDSATVGRSGAALKRLALEIARALSFPPLTIG